MNNPIAADVPPVRALGDDDGVDLFALLHPVLMRWKIVLAAAVAGAGLAVGASYLSPPRYTANTLILAPQAQQSAAANALASLGALSDLAGGGGGATRRSAEQYIAMMQSATVSDRVIKKFELRKLWPELKFQVDARKRLAAMVAISVGKKEGLMQIAVTDIDPERAAAIANQYVEELRALTKTLAITEAQQRRVFFEQLLEQTRDKLAAAQGALEASGYSAGALNAEPRTAAEGYARIRAELTAAEVKLRVLRNSRAEGSAEVLSQRETVDALTSQLAKLEAQELPPKASGDYINRYREFKYQETLFNLFAHDYESARVDEARDGALVQVIDPATRPERKSAPLRKTWAIAGFGAGLLLASAWFMIRGRHRAAVPDAARMGSRRDAS